MPTTKRVAPRRVALVRNKREQGFALLISMIALAVLAILVTDLHETTGMSFTAATAERDQLRAEYLAKSGLNLTRMLIGQEKNLRQVIAPVYQLLLKRPPPQMPVWRFADALLKPFADFNAAKEDVSSAGVDVENAEGLGDVHGTFEIESSSESGKVNANDPRLESIAASQINMAGMFFAMMGGYAPSPSKYDPLFSKMDEKGRLSTRLDLTNNVMDWWDQDTAKANFDIIANAVLSSGAEQTDYYREQLEPYNIKNAPFDTIEEMRLVQGMTDDIWSTFVEPDADDPSTRQISIYGITRMNPNEAEPSVLWNRICSFQEVRTQPLCDPTGTEPLKFINLVATSRMLANGVPWFSRATDFMNFITGAQDSLYSMLSSMLGGGNNGAAGGTSLAGAAAGGSSLLFTPVKMPNPDTTDLNNRMKRMFGTTGNIFSINVTGKSGIAQRRIKAIVNTDAKWTPPKPNAGKLPPLGVFAYYRID